MIGNGFRAALLAFGLFWSQSGCAQPLPSPLILLGVLPNPSVEGQMIAGRFEHTSCAGSLPGTVSIQQHVVTLTVPVILNPCGVPPPGHVVDAPLGAFPPGVYTLILVTAHADQMFLPQTTQFTVRAGLNPAAVPAASRQFLLLLLLALLGAGALRLTASAGRSP